VAVPQHVDDPSRRQATLGQQHQGVVEEIGKEEKKGFLGPDSLWRILTTSRRESVRKGGTIHVPKGGHT
jgi:hypothetical protein